MQILFLIIAIAFVWVGLTVLYWPPLLVVIGGALLVSAGVSLGNNE